MSACARGDGARPSQKKEFFHARLNKGIALRVDPKQDNYEVLPGRKLTVVFSDPNGKEIAKAFDRFAGLKHGANELRHLRPRCGLGSASKSEAGARRLSG